MEVQNSSNIDLEIGGIFHYLQKSGCFKGKIFFFLMVLWGFFKGLLEFLASKRLFLNGETVCFKGSLGRTNEEPLWVLTFS